MTLSVTPGQDSPSHRLSMPADVADFHTALAHAAGPAASPSPPARLPAAGPDRQGIHDIAALITGKGSAFVAGLPAEVRTYYASTLHDAAAGGESHHVPNAESARDLLENAPARPTESGHLSWAVRMAGDSIPNMATATALAHHVLSISPAALSSLGQAKLGQLYAQLCGARSEGGPPGQRFAVRHACAALIQAGSSLNLGVTPSPNDIPDLALAGPEATAHLLSSLSDDQVRALPAWRTIFSNLSRPSVACASPAVQTQAARLLGLHGVKSRLQPRLDLARKKFPFPHPQLRLIRAALPNKNPGHAATPKPPLLITHGKLPHDMREDARKQTDISMGFLSEMEEEYWIGNGGDSAAADDCGFYRLPGEEELIPIPNQMTLVPSETEIVFGQIGDEDFAHFKLPPAK